MNEMKAEFPSTFRVECEVYLLTLSAPNGDFDVSAYGFRRIEDFFLSALVGHIPAALSIASRLHFAQT
jgi:hypothetical protein